MAGHNKWSKVKRKKEEADQKKSKVFSVLARSIALEAKNCGGDKNSPGLRRIIERARSENMPNENIERAVARGLGSEEENLESIICEAYCPGGAAIIILAITNNKNRTVSSIKHTLSVFGISLASQGSALWAFNSPKDSDSWQAKTILPLDKKDSEQLREIIEELEKIDDVTDVLTNGTI